MVFSSDGAIIDLGTANGPEYETLQKWRMTRHDHRLVPDLFMLVASLCCILDGPVFSVSGKVISDIAKVLDNRTVKGDDLRFNGTLLLQASLGAGEVMCSVPRIYGNWA